MFKEEKELWIKFACAALSGCIGTLEERISAWNADSVYPDDEIDEEDLIQDDCKYAAQYADRMLTLYYDKFKDC